MNAEQWNASAAAHLPALFCPIRPYHHPLAEAIDKKACEWVRSRGIPQDPVARQRLLTSGCSRVFSNCSPHGAIERLETGGKWMYLGFVYDDWFESCTSLEEIVAVSCALQRAQEAPESALTDVPFLPAFLEIMHELHNFATPTQYRRFTSERRGYFQSIPWEASYRLAGSTPDLNANVTLRLGVTAAAAFLVALEISNGAEIPSAEFDHPALQAVREITTLLLGWVNDLYSIPKDSHDGGGVNNLVTCLQRERKCALKDATAEAITMWNRSMLLFLKLRAQLTAQGSPQLKRFLGDCSRAISNATAWHTENPRYAAPAFSVTVDLPVGLDPSPLDIPSISWWWRQLD
ncbi:terpene synthase family protein [[Kitasatospora] papulosa]|uniref:terpene synthase family protein n=1 Tax=Streptomyces TaxID=1883 RepID=UPI0034420335